MRFELVVKKDVPEGKSRSLKRIIKQAYINCCSNSSVWDLKKGVLEIKQKANTSCKCVCVGLRYFCSLFFLVPIIPSYLYTVDDEASTKDTSTPTAIPFPSANTFQTIVSLYDNSTYQTSGVGLLSTPRPQALSTPMAPATTNNTTVSDCPKGDKQLLNENVKVGLLFASKATVQLLTNPFIGPLTNRWVTHVGGTGDDEIFNLDKISAWTNTLIFVKCVMLSGQIKAKIIAKLKIQEWNMAIQ